MAKSILGKIEEKVFEGKTFHESRIRKYLTFQTVQKAFVLIIQEEYTSVLVSCNWHISIHEFVSCWVNLRECHSDLSGFWTRWQRGAAHICSNNYIELMLFIMNGLMKLCKRESFWAWHLRIPTSFPSDNAKESASNTDTIFSPLNSLIANISVATVPHCTWYPACISMRSVLLACKEVMNVSQPSNNYPVWWNTKFLIIHLNIVRISMPVRCATSYGKCIFIVLTWKTFNRFPTFSLHKYGRRTVSNTFNCVIFVQIWNSQRLEWQQPFYTFTQQNILQIQPTLNTFCRKIISLNVHHSLFQLRPPWNLFCVGEINSLNG